MTIFFFKSVLSIVIIFLAVLAMFTMYEVFKRNRAKFEMEKTVGMPKSDPVSIARGQGIFEDKCSFCHDAYSTESIVGPGLKGVLKKSKLPVSKRLATQENIIDQFKKPFNRMPSFEYLTEEETKDIIAFLHTL